MVNYSCSLDLTFGALADPTRREMLSLLARGESKVTDLAKQFNVSLPAISKHLRVLERAGLLERRKDGRVHRLKLKAKPMEEAQEWINSYRAFWEGQFDQLESYLEQQQSLEARASQVENQKIETNISKRKKSS